MKKIGKMHNPRFALFGTGRIARAVTEELERAGHLPVLVITAPDKPAGRGLESTPSPVKAWARTHEIETLQPEKIDFHILETMNMSEWDVFVVADYGLILPKDLLAIPKHGTLNMHPSLLPRLRGPSPIRSTILLGEDAGVSVMLMDEKMDHGPVIAQKKVAPPESPPRGSALDELLAREGGKLLAQVFPAWIAGEIEAQEQQHDIATYTKKFSKEDGLLDLSADPRQNLLKIRAFEGWPGTYAFFERSGKRLRVAILDAEVRNDALVLTRVKPEGRDEMAYEDFLRSGAKPCQ